MQIEEISHKWEKTFLIHITTKEKHINNIKISTQKMKNKSQNCKGEELLLGEEIQVAAGYTVGGHTELRNVN